MGEEKDEPTVKIVKGAPADLGEHFGLILEVEPPSCPECGSTNFIPIVYGYPTTELFAEEEEGKLKLGGCVEAPGASSRWFCNVCHYAWR